MADTYNYTATKTASTLNVVAGAWLIISPWAIGYAEVVAATWNNVVIGALVVIFAGIRLMFPDRYPGFSWINAVLGVWLIVAPWVFQFGELARGAVWNDTLVGIAIAIIAAGSALSTVRHRTR
jgi:hypothetical protein